MSRHRPNPQHRQGDNGNPNNGQSGYSRQVPSITVGISSPYTERAARASIMVDQAYGRMSRRYGRKQMDGGRFRKFTNQIEMAVLEFERAIHNAMNEMNHQDRPKPNGAQKPQAGKTAPSTGKPTPAPAAGKASPTPAAVTGAAVTVAAAAGVGKTGGNGHDKPTGATAALKTGGNGADVASDKATDDDVVKNLESLNTKLRADQTGKKVGVWGARSSSTKPATPTP